MLTKNSALVNPGKQLMQELKQVTTYYPMPKPEKPEVKVNNEQSQHSEGIDEVIPLPDNDKQAILAPSSAPREIIGDVGEVNILEGKRTRKPSSRALGFTIQGLEIELEKLPRIGMAFSILQSVNKRIHQSKLPPPPQHFHELKNHPHAEGFQEAILLEFNNLRNRQTF
jgi:hypothetical protein